MHKIKMAVCGMITLLSMNSMAITIEEMSDKNNKIIELDQDIAIAEKNKKLTQLKNESIQSEIILLPRNVVTKRDESISVLSVHGSPSDPVVDVQYGDRVLQRRRGESLPDGWQMVAIGHGTVTFNKRLPNKPSVVKTVGIGQGAAAMPEGLQSNLPTNLPISAPSH